MTESVNLQKQHGKDQNRISNIHMKQVVSKPKRCDVYRSKEYILVFGAQSIQHSEEVAPNDLSSTCSMITSNGPGYKIAYVH